MPLNAPNYSHVDLKPNKSIDLWSQVQKIIAFLNSRPALPLSYPSSARPYETQTRGFIEEYRDFVLQHIPTDRLWAESIAIAILTSVLQFFTLPTIIGNLKLNLNILGIGPSGLAHKTSPLKYFAIPLIRELQSIVGHKMQHPKSFSIEGYIEYLHKHNSTGIIIGDEFTRIIKASEGGGYLTEILEFLSELYDGLIQIRYTRSAKLEEVLDVYVTFVSATSEYLYKLLKPDLFMQGTGNRFLYVVMDEPPFARAPANFFDIQVGNPTQLRNKEFAKALSKIWNIGEFIVSPMATEILLKYHDEMKEKAHSIYMHRADINSLEDLYLARVPEMCFKLAAIKAVSDHYLDIEKYKNLRMLAITEDQAQWAIDRSRKYFEQFQKMMKTWNAYKQSQIRITNRDAIDKDTVLQCVKRYGIISQQLLLKEGGFAKTNRFYDLIWTLISEGRIRQMADYEILSIPDSERVKYGIGDIRGQTPNVYQFVKD